MSGERWEFEVHPRIFLAILVGVPLFFGIILWLLGQTIEFFEFGLLIGAFVSLFFGGKVVIPVLWRLGVKVLLRSPRRRAAIKAIYDFIAARADPVCDAIAKACDNAGRNVEEFFGPIAFGLPEFLVYLFIGWLLQPLFASCSCGFLLLLLLIWR